MRKGEELREEGREKDPISESSEFSHSHGDESTREHNIWRWRWQETTAIRAREEGAAELCNMVRSNPMLEGSEFALIGQISLVRAMSCRVSKKNAAISGNLQTRTRSESDTQLDVTICFFPRQRLRRHSFAS